MRKTILLFVLYVLSHSLVAQQLTIKGKVLDSDGNAIPGVTVLVVGTTTGTSTDLDGDYVLSNVKIGSTLRFSFIGYVSQEFTVEAGKPAINVIMLEETSMLDEVTVVAFGTQKKESVVSSISTVNIGDIKVPSSNLTTAFAGRIAGLISYQTSGEPGADNAEFFVRGVSSFEGSRSSPLILIDGFEATRNDLARLQPDDIESFSVMKDATATVLYGARGANGILIVNTKSGKEGKLRINARIDVNIATPTRIKAVLDGIPYMRMYNEAQISRNPEAVPFYSEQKIQSTMRGEDPMIYPNINWYDELFNPSTINTKANINISGGGKAATYYVAVGFDHDTGLLKVAEMNNFNNNIDINRVHVRNNIILNLSPTTKLDTRIQGRFEKYNGPSRSANDIYNMVMRANPVDHPVIYRADEASKFADHILFGNTFNNDQQIKQNPFAEMVRGYEQRNENRILAQASLLQDLDFITPGLKMQVKAAAQTWSISSGTRSYTPFYYGIDSYNLVTGEHKLYSLNPTNTNYKLGDVSPNNDSDALFNGELRFNWDRDFNKHNLGAMLVGIISEKLLTSGKDHSIYETLPERNLGVSGRGTYGYDSRYFLEFAFGYNGSEKFSSDRAFGFFPSFGIGWLVSNEPYWKISDRIISNMKLRYSWGRVGNDLLDGRGGRFFYLSSYNRGGGSYTFGTDFLNSHSGYSISNYANADISWEVSTKFNYGIELGLLRNQGIRIQADYFVDERDNIYEVRNNYPHSAGLEVAIKSNSGKIRSSGIDLSVDIEHSFHKDFWVTGRGTFTYADNKILLRDEPNYRDSYRSQIGYSTTQRWGLVAERLFVDQLEIESSPKQFDGNYLPGDIKYKDINGDGVINSEDRVPMGWPTSPKIQYGFGLSTGYKKFDLSFFFQGNAKVSFFIDSSSSGNGIAPFVNRRNALEIVARDYWSETNPNVHAFWPRLSVTDVSNNTQQSSWWLRNNSFLRLKTLETGYSISSLKNIGVENLRLYFIGENFFLLSQFKLWDPEQGSNGMGYPLTRKYNFGIQLTF
jgi:TonB-linked SusC/RagA family outer membrane protein